MARIWMRHETRPTERRAPIAPDDAARLVAHGIAVTVEESPQRVFPIAGYAAAGCAVAPAGGWVDAPDRVYVVGLKELPDEPAALRHRHVYFGHSYKGQPGARDLLDRFAAGGGALLDLEYLVDGAGRRQAAFGYWAGYAGAALAVLHHRGRLPTPLRSTSRGALTRSLRRPATPAASPEPERALVIGALGRSGRGARDALRAAGIEPTCWDLDETRVLDVAALLDHDILVNAVLVREPVAPFLTREALRRPGRRLSVVADVTCDAGSACNVLPIYDRPTSWAEPVHPVDGLDIIAIDNLPSLLPRQASLAFSAELTPHLTTLGDAAWQRCLRSFHDAMRVRGELTHA